MTEQLRLAAALGLAAATLYVDVTTPPQTLAGVAGYFFALALCMWVNWRFAIHLVGAFAIVGVVVGYLVQTEAYATQIQFAYNRAVLVACVVLFAIIMHRLRSFQARLEDTNEDLSRRVAEQTVELRTQRERFHELALAASDSFWRVDAQGENIELSENTIDALGGALGSLTKRSIDWLLQNVSASERARVDAAMQAREPFSVMSAAPTSDGTVWLEIHARPVFEDDVYAGYQGVLRNVTERVELENGLRDAQVMEAVGRLSAGLAHDLNNLLSIITGNIELARYQPATGNEHLEHARFATQRGAELARMLLDCARAHRSDEVTDVGQAIGKAAELIRPMIGEHRLETQLSRRLPRVRISTAALESAIVNLCLNARDAMANPGTIVIRTDQDPDSGRVVLSVGDSGSGMSEGVRRRVLEPFFTTKEQRRGSGMGLSMVAMLMEQAEGEVAISSAKDVGTVVELRMPAATGA